MRGVIVGILQAIGFESLVSSFKPTYLKAYTRSNPEKYFFGGWSLRKRALESVINVTYPRVVIVTMVYQNAAGMLVNLVSISVFSR